MTNARPTRPTRAARPDLPGPHLRLPDERARLRAALRPARGRPATCRAAERRPGRRRRLQHLRRAGERRQQALRQPRPPAPGQGRPSPGMQIAVGGCLAQKDRGEIVRRAPWVDVVFGTHNIGSLPALLERARHNERGPGRDPRVARGLPLDAADPPRVDLRRLGLDLGRLQQHLHVLHRARACAARRRTAARATSWPRSRRWSPRACSRSPCSARTSTPTASSSATGWRSASCCAPAASVDGLERVRFTSPHPAAFTDDVIEAMAETPNVMPQLHMPLQSGLGPRAAGDAPVLPQRALPRHHRPGARGDAGRRDHHRHHRRLPRRDRGRLPGHPRRRAGRRGSRRPSPSSTPRGPARRPPRWPTRCRRPSCRSATSGSSPCRSEISWAENQAPGRVATLEVLVADGEGRKDAATDRMSGRAPDNRLVHFAVPAGRATARGPGDVVTVAGHLRRAAPPGRRRCARRRPLRRPPHPGRRRLGPAREAQRRPVAAFGRMRARVRSRLGLPGLRTRRRPVTAGPAPGLGSRGPDPGSGVRRPGSARPACSGSRRRRAGLGSAPGPGIGSRRGDRARSRCRRRRRRGGRVRDRWRRPGATRPPALLGPAGGGRRPCRSPWCAVAAGTAMRAGDFGGRGRTPTRRGLVDGRLRLPRPGSHRRSSAVACSWPSWPPPGRLRRPARASCWVALARPLARARSSAMATAVGVRPGARAQGDAAPPGVRRAARLRPCHPRSPRRRRRRRPDRDRQVRPGVELAPAARRRGRQRRRDAALPRHGHRHRQAERGRAARRAAPPARRAGTSPRRPASRSTSARPGRPSPTSAAGAVRRPGRRLGALRARGARRAGLPRHRPAVARRARGASWPRSARRPCTPGWPASTRPPRRRSCRPTAAASSARSRSSSSPGGRSPRTLPEPGVRRARRVQIGLRSTAADARRAHRRPGRPDVGSAAWSTRSRRWPRRACASGRTASPRARLRPGPAPRSTAGSRWTQARAETAQATRRFARRQESWFGRDPRVAWLDADRPDLADRARDLRRAGGRTAPAGDDGSAWAGD